MTTTMSDEVAALLKEDPDHEDTTVVPDAPTWQAPGKEAQNIPRDSDRDVIRGVGRDVDYAERRSHDVTTLVTDRGNPRHREQQAAIGAMLDDSHGLTVKNNAWSRAWELPRHCRFCGGDIPIIGVDYDVCEFERWPWQGCRCNACTTKRYKLKRARGNQPTVCGSSECYKAQNRERQKRYRERRKVEGS